MARELVQVIKRAGPDWLQHSFNRLANTKGEFKVVIEAQRSDEHYDIIIIGT